MINSYSIEIAMSKNVEVAIQELELYEADEKIISDAELRLLTLYLPELLEEVLKQVATEKE